MMNESNSCRYIGTGRTTKQWCQKSPDTAQKHAEQLETPLKCLSLTQLPLHTQLQLSALATARTVWYVLYNGEGQTFKVKVQAR